MTLLALVVTAATWTAAPGPAAPLEPAREEYEKLAPWPAVRWRDDVPEVELDGRWHELVAIDGTKQSEVVAFCRKRWPNDWQKRFEEDLVEALARMGKPAGTKVKLDLVDLATKKKLRRDDVAMTAANRQQLWRARKEAAAPVPAKTEAPATLPRDDALADLDELARTLREEYAYYARTGDAFEKELASAKQSLPATIERAAFAQRVQALLASLGDGHTGLRDLEAFLPAGFLPFLVGESADGLVAFRPDRTAFVDDRHPFLKQLDGLPIDRWLAAAAPLVARGSTDFVRAGSIRQLRFVALLRPALALPASDTIRVELADERGRTTTKELRLSAQKPVYGEWPRQPSRKLADDVGYLRISEMDDAPAAIAAMHSALDGFAGAAALVIDVRGNGGGSRLPLRELFPRFMQTDDEPRIANAAAYRLPKGVAAGVPDGYLADRWLFPTTAREWSDDERGRLVAFEKAFRPAWSPPRGAFSAWHWFVLRPELAPARGRFEGKVAILQDTACFSATDVFLGAFKGWRDVTLLGTRSGGGSGRAVGHALPRSGLEYRASTMASFRADGTLYDGVGIEPDVVVLPAAGDFLGRGDAVLDRALKLLSAPAR